VTAGVRCAVQTIGFSPAADWWVKHDPATRRTELLNPERQTVAAWTTPMPGEHNAMNAATAAALASMLGAKGEAVAAALTGFRGLDRRSQFLGERPHPLGGVVRVYDDYGHHPTEVESTLKALRQAEAPEKRNGRLICVFQPHQHSRTRHLLEEFANAFSEADVVIVPNIYFVRDSAEEKQKVTAADLVDRLRAKRVLAMHLYPFEAIVEQLENLCRPGDLLVVMGAGPVYQVAHGFLKAGAPAGRRP
jgi:UDP-N-acetylmuramate--alanine ligase